MNTMKNSYLTKAGALLFSGLLMLSCTDSDDPATRGQLSISIDNSLVDASAKSAVAAKAINADLSLSEFWINIEEFELEVDYEDDYYENDNEQSDDDEQWDDDGYYDFEDEIELEGPFEVDLLAGQVELMNISVPVGEFEELEFEFDKSMNPESELYGKSILVKGSYAGTPFVFWHDFNEEVEVDFEDVAQNIVIIEGAESITINFDITAIFNHDFGVDLSMAADGNGDGTIEISPMDEDGNNDLANAIKEAIKKNVELLED